MSLFERNGRWYAIIYVNGKQRWVPVPASLSTKKQRQTYHDELVIKNRRGQLVIPKPITFEEFSELWIRDYCEVSLKPVTVAEYRGYLRKYLVPAFGGMKMTAIRPEHAQRHVANLTRENRLKPKTIKNQMVPAKRMFELAIRWGYATTNPFERLALPRLEHEEVAFLSPQEVRRLIDATDPKWRALVALGAMCGMRKGECLGLAHDGILWAEKKIQIRQSLWNGQIQEPKTRRSVSKIPMSPTVEALLMERVVNCPASQMNLVFCRADGSPLRPDYVNRGILKPALERAGLPAVSFHALRHSFVAGLISQNVPIKVIQELARHASIQTTLDKYGHILPDSKEDAIQKLEAAVWSSTLEE